MVGLQVVPSGKTRKGESVSAAVSAAFFDRHLVLVVVVAAEDTSGGAGFFLGVRRLLGGLEPEEVAIICWFASVASGRGGSGRRALCFESM